MYEARKIQILTGQQLRRDINASKGILRRVVDTKIAKLPSNNIYIIKYKYSVYIRNKLYDV